MTSLNELLSPEPDARIMMRWWWFGPTITPGEIDRELGLMKDAGIGGVEISFLYPVTLESDAFLSPPFLGALEHAAATAKRLGMLLDITLGSGWPYGGPHVTPPLQARKLNIVEVELSAGTSSYDLPEDHGDAEIVVAMLRGETVPFMAGKLTLPAALEKPALLRLLLSVPTRQRVKRAALGAEGFVLDHYREDALAAHLVAVGEPLVYAVGRRARAIFCDSLEVYHSNWTPRFLEDFARLRGYDLRPHLAALLAAMDVSAKGEIGLVNASEDLGDILHDYAQTLQELFEQNFLLPLRDFAHQHGLASRVQVYGIPPTSLSSYRYVDIPEGETTLGDSEISQPADWTELTPNRFAASAGRYYGHRIISGETWTRLHSPPYAATPLDMKAEADQFFLQGINQLIGHGWCQRPAGGDPSQWVFYAAANFNEANPWHPVLPELAHYLQRLCSLLRMGTPIVDVALYLPDHDVMSGRTFSTEKANLHHVNGLRAHITTALTRALLAAGYNFDLVDDHILQESAGNHGLKQKIILLPNIYRLPLETLEALRALHDDGAWLVAVGSLPSRAAGRLRQTESETVARLAEEIFRSGRYPRARFQPSLDPAELARCLAPDVALDQETPRIGYLHRDLGDREMYFFVNTTNQVIEFTPRFREDQRGWTWVNAMSGLVTNAGPGPARLEAYESVIALTEEQTRPCEVAAKPFHEIALDHGWTLSIPAKGTALPLKQPQLWTDFPEHQHFSGEAVYACTFQGHAQFQSGAQAWLIFEDARPVTPHRFQPDRRNTGFSVFLDAPIKDAAVVFLNGQRVGSLFAPPYRLDLGGALSPGQNLLEIRVYNRVINELSARQLFDFTPVHAAYGTRFESIQDFENLQSAPSGLTGRVRIQYVR